jgi:hypothetical protein
MTKTVRTITVAGVRFALPDGMSNKDIQQLGGFLLTLARVEVTYSKDYRTDYYYLTSPEAVSLGEHQVHANRDEAKAAAEKADAAKAEAEATTE